jgi:hypothetical protein
MKKRHDTLKAGAVVRVDGFAPARVLEVYRERGELYALVSFPRDVAAHGFARYFKKGETGAFIAARCVPRDVIRVSRQHIGRLWWPSFSVVEG